MTSDCDVDLVRPRSPRQERCLSWPHPSSGPRNRLSTLPTPRDCRAFLPWETESRLREPARHAASLRSGVGRTDQSRPRTARQPNQDAPRPALIQPALIQPALIWPALIWPAVMWPAVIWLAEPATRRHLFATDDAPQPFDPGLDVALVAVLGGVVVGGRE